MAVAELKVISQNVIGGAEENHDKPQDSWSLKLPNTSSMEQKSPSEADSGSATQLVIRLT
jgi:hypothetical protein